MTAPTALSEPVELAAHLGATTLRHTLGNIVIDAHDPGDDDAIW